MDLLESIDKEVNDIVERMAPEVALLLIEKLEKDFELDAQRGISTINELRRKYVSLKIMAHRMSRSWDNGLIHSSSEEKFQSNLNHLDSLIKNARRNYYVAKRRYEGEHDFNCTCRGCRCIKGLDGISEDAIAILTGRT